MVREDMPAYTRLQERRHKATIHLLCVAMDGSWDEALDAIVEGADVNYRCEPTFHCGMQVMPGYAPLHAAAWEGDDEIIELLVDEGADVNLQDTDGMTALMFLADIDRTGQSEESVRRELNAARILLRADGVDVNVCSRYGTALDFAMRRGKDDLVRILFDAGATLIAEFIADKSIHRRLATNGPPDGYDTVAKVRSWVTEQHARIEKKYGLKISEDM